MPNETPRASARYKNSPFFSSLLGIRYMNWIINNFDRFLALVAILLALVGIVIAAVAMWDVRRLFKELESRDKNTEHQVRQGVLKELLTATASFATFSRAAQFIDFYPGQPDRATAIAMLMAFRIQQLIAPDAKKEDLAELRKTTRNQLEKEAAEWAQTITSSGIGKMKDDWEFNHPPKER